MAVDIVHSWEEVRDFFHSGQYDVIVLDNHLLPEDRFQRIIQIRQGNPQIPIMLLVGENQSEMGITGLEAGADDFLIMPFVFREFVARIKALSRRSMGKCNERILDFCGMELDGNRYELKNKERTIKLNNKEYQLMELFFSYPGYVFSTKHLMDKIWECDSTAGVEVVWTYIGFLRKKLKELDAEAEIKTVRGAGYSLEQVKNKKDE